MVENGPGMGNPRVYGSRPFYVAVIHGGPGAPGEMAPVARELSQERGILEPLQTEASMDGQVEELKKVIETYADLPVTLVGFSWGAMLGFVFGALHPFLVKKLILVGSPPFEEKYAAEIQETRLGRLTESERSRVRALIRTLDDPSAADKNAPFAELGGLLAKADAYDRVPASEDPIECQYHIYRQVWEDARELRRNGRLLELGKQVSCPVVAIHGDHDPHPSEGVRVPLSRILKDFRLILLPHCGHAPWRERGASEGFYDILRRELP